MSILSIILIALILSVDTFAVSLCVDCKENNLYTRLRFAFILAVFQGGMPFVGWILGSYIGGYIHNASHWIAFSIFVILGVKMLVDSFNQERKTQININSFYVVFLLSIATSIDALAMGISFGVLSESIILKITIIFLTTFIVSVMAQYLSAFLKKLVKVNFDLIGGLLLIMIGSKMLISYYLIS